MRHCLFLAQRVLSHCSLIRFFLCVSNICSYYFKTLSVWNRKRVFLRILYSWLLFCLQKNSSSLSLYVFPSSGFLFLENHSSLKISWWLNMCSGGTLLASLNFTFCFPFFYHAPPIFLELESICFGVSTYLSLTFVNDGKDVLCYNLHSIGGICKEVWLKDFFIKSWFLRN